MGMTLPTTGPTTGERIALSRRRHAEALQMGGEQALSRHRTSGRQVRAGDRVFLVLPSANRDKGTLADPDRFGLGRPAKPLHVGFGRRLHACLGAQLARIEARAERPRILGPTRGHPRLRRGDLAADRRVRGRDRTEVQP